MNIREALLQDAEQSNSLLIQVADPPPLASPVPFLFRIVSQIHLCTSGLQTRVQPRLVGEDVEETTEYEFPRCIARLIQVRRPVLFLVVGIWTTQRFQAHFDATQILSQTVVKITRSPSVLLVLRTH